jgi:sugar phosphate isomerase/epimerase
MRFGVNAWVWTSPLTTAELETLAPHVAQMGFDWIEVPLESLDDLDFRRGAAMIKEHGLGVSCCAAMGPDRDLVHPDPAIRANGMAYLRGAIEATAALGATNLVGPIYSAVGRTWPMSPEERARDTDLLVENLSRLAEHARQYGVVLCIEPLNRFETSFINLASQAVEVVDRVNSPHCQVMLDTFHMNIEEKSLGEAIRTAGPRLKHFHDPSPSSPANGPICRSRRSAKRPRRFGYDGVEIACWGDHFEVDKALSDDSYCRSRWDILNKYGLQCFAISNHLVGQAVCDNIDIRHKAILPPRIYGDGDPEGVRQRAAEEMKNTARAAAKFGVKVVPGFTGSSIWHLLYSFPPIQPGQIEAGYKDFADRWNPILDVFDEVGVKFALEAHPTEIAFDIASAQAAVNAVGGRKAFGFNFDPSHFGYQGVDYVRFIRTFGDRIYHVHMKDVYWSPTPTEAGVFGGHLNFGDARRFWDFRSLGGAASTSRRSSAPSTPSATRDRSPSNGRIAGWIAWPARPRPQPSSRGSISRLQPWPSTRPSRRNSPALHDLSASGHPAAGGHCRPQQGGDGDGRCSFRLREVLHRLARSHRRSRGAALRQRRS